MIHALTRKEFSLEIRPNSLSPTVPSSLNADRSNTYTPSQYSRTQQAIEQQAHG